ncbi:hypothetical protein JCM5353_002253 [Sporobolomyces roseus]
MSLPSLETLSISDSPPPSPPRDRLTTLPPELFDQISSDVYTPDYSLRYPYLAGVSQAFVHQARRNLFSRIFIRDQANLKKLITRCRLRSDEDLFTFLSELVSLKYLEVKAFQRLSKIVANPPSWLQPLPNLRSLFLIDAFSDWRNPFDFQHWTSLSRYPHLTSFSLSHKRPGYVPPPRFPEKRSPFPPNTSITTIYLAGWLHRNAAISDLLEHLPNLGIVMYKEKSLFPENNVGFLDDIPHPERLEHLTVSELEDWDEGLPAALRRFQGLDSLTLATGTWQSPEITDVLISLPKLESLYLGDTPNIDEVIRFMAHSTSLKSIRFNNLSEPEEPLALPDQFGDGWTDEFTPEGVVEAIRTAIAKGISIGGGAVDMAYKIHWLRKNKAHEDKKERISRAGGEGDAS